MCGDPANIEFHSLADEVVPTDDPFDLYAVVGEEDGA